MATVRIADKKVWVDDLGIPLISGEVHYWRLDPANWRPALRRARQMGLQVCLSVRMAHNWQLAAAMAPIVFIFSELKI